MNQKRISRYISRFLASSLLALLPLGTFAQSQRLLPQAKDTTSLFRGVAVSADVIGLIQMAVGSYGQYEAAMRVNLKDKYFPVIELGLGKADAEDAATRLSYKTTAPYGRVGLDLNLMKNKHDINRLYGGLRYAYTSYKFDLFCPEITDPYWGHKTEFNYPDIEGNCHWLEFVGGVDAKIWGPIRLGWSVRFKRRLAHNDGQAGNAWYVPGFGKSGNTRLGGTFNVIFELGGAKQPKKKIEKNGE